VLESRLDYYIMHQEWAQARRDYVRLVPAYSRRDVCTIPALRREARRDTHKTIRTWLD
jgi:hypothetical protein